MRRPPISFEWQVAEDEAAWEEMVLAPELFTEEPPSLAAVDRRIGLVLLRGAAICLASIVLVAGVGLPQAERDRFHATTGIQAVLAKEAQAAAQSESEEPATMPLTNPLQVTIPALQARALPATLHEAGVGLVRVEPLGELTLAEVSGQRTVQGWHQVSPYRETRFYRETATGWRQTTPERAFWGPLIRRETAHLRFEYFTRDAESIATLMAEIDALYTGMHTRLGLPLPSTVHKLTIEILPSRLTGRGLYRDRLQVSSPLMAQIPIQFSATTFLTHQIVSGLLTSVISSTATGEAIGVPPQDSFAFRWRTMRRGLRSWLQTALIGQAWPWDQQAAELFLRTQQAHFPVTLDNITWGTEVALTDEERLMWQDAAAESVVAYVVAVYGEDRLPELLRGFYRYNDWRDLVAGTFGISPEAFEAGWNRYLAKQAGLPLEYIQVYNIRERSP